MLRATIIRARARRNKNIQFHTSFYKGLAVAVLGIGLLAGCAYRDEGAIDYRKGTIATGAGRSLLGADFANRNPKKDNYGENVVKIPGRNLQNEDLRLVELRRKNTESNNKNAAFTKDDSVTIRLQSAFINWFSEAAGSYIGDLIAEGQFLNRGEIAIVVNAFQINKSGSDNSLDFSKNGFEKGRVVYYSPDVMSKQFLNFNNMPVYGPVTYDGTPIGLDIAVIELDETDQVTVGLLTELGKLGAKAFPVAAPELAVLNSLGEALINSQTNDVNGRYHVLFDSADSGHPDIPHTTLEVGYYVFIRAQDRTVDIDWEDLFLDENSGALYVKKRDIENFEKLQEEMKGKEYVGNDAFGPYVVEPYTANNYFVFDIDKNKSAKKIDLANYTYEKFLEGIDAEINKRFNSLTKITDAATGLVEERAQVAYFDDIRSDLSALNKEVETYRVTNKSYLDLKKNQNPSEKQAIEISKIDNARQQEKSNVLSRFNKIWRAFGPTMEALPKIEKSSPSKAAAPAKATAPAKAATLATADAPAKPKEPDKATEPATKTEVLLTANQRDYVLRKLRESVEPLTNISAFEVTGISADMSVDERRKNTCKQLLNIAKESTDDTCN